MKNNIEINKIFNTLRKFLKNKPRGLHDPLFLGNEKKYLLKCISSGYVSSVGKFVNIFEKKISFYTKSKYAVALINGTSALHLALRYFNLSKKDEVLLPSLTYVATINAIKYCGSSANFLDIEEDTLGICPKKLELYLRKISIKKGKFTFNKRTGKKIKALIAVHLYGFPCKIDKIKKICKRYNIILIEDAAEALGSFYLKKHLGTFGDMGILSFNGNKPITCGNGGMIITNNKKASNFVKHLSVHAKKKSNTDHIHDNVGYNYRMSNLSAAVGCAQMENINLILKLKRKNFKLYEKIFKKFEPLKILNEPKFSKSNYWLIVAKFKKKNLKNIFLRKTRSLGIISRSVWRPLHTLKIFNNCEKDNLENTLKVFNDSVTLPSSPGISR